MSPRRRLLAVWRELESRGATVRRVPLKRRDDFELSVLAADAEHRLRVIDSPEARAYWLPPEAS